MLAKPGTSRIGRSPGRMFAGRGKVPGIADNVRGPPLGSVKGTGRCLAGRNDGPGKIDQRGMQLGKVPRLGKPMVHLQVDVQVVIAVPRSLDGIGPESLQVWRQLSGTRRGDQQIAPVLVIQGIQPGIVFCAGCGKPFIRGNVRQIIYRAELEGDPVKQPFVCADMILAQPPVAFVECLSQEGVAVLFRIIGEIIRSRRKDQRGFFHVVQNNAVAGKYHRSFF